MKLDKEYYIVHYTGLISVRPIYSYFLVKANKIYLRYKIEKLCAVKRHLPMDSTLRSRRGACSMIDESGGAI